MKETVTRIGITLIALIGIIAGLFQLYELYTLGITGLDREFSELFSDPIILGVVISIFTIIVSIGLFFHNKISRWITLFSGYSGLMFTLFSVAMLVFIELKHPSAAGIPIFIVLISLASALIFILIIYLLTNQAALRLFGIQRESNRLEVTLFSVVTLLLVAMPYILSEIVKKLLSQA